MASSGPMACRGCAAKLPAQPLQAAKQVGLGGARKMPLRLPVTHRCCKRGQVPGPAQRSLVERTPDGSAYRFGPLGLRCCRGRAGVMTLPVPRLGDRQELLAQTLAGVRSVLGEQQARLIDGHTLKPAAQPPAGGAGLQLNFRQWSQRWPHGDQLGDALLLSRPLDGVLFAAAMAGAAPAAALDHVLRVMSGQPAHLLDQLRAPSRQHPCLHGHHRLRVAGASGNARGQPPHAGCSATRFRYPQALDLLEQGRPSSLARPADAAGGGWIRRSSWISPIAGAAGAAGGSPDLWPTAAGLSGHPGVNAGRRGPWQRLALQQPAVAEIGERSKQRKPLRSTSRTRAAVFGSA